VHPPEIPSRHHALLTADHLVETCLFAPWLQSYLL
jgi:hypothetical protein